MVVAVQQKKISINFIKAITKFYLSLHYNGDENYLYVNKREIYEFKAKGNINCYNFCLRSVSKDDEHKMNKLKFL